MYTIYTYRNMHTYTYTYACMNHDCAKLGQPVVAKMYQNSSAWNLTPFSYQMPSKKTWFQLLSLVGHVHSRRTFLTHFPS